MTCFTCLSPWVQKPAGEQTGALGVQWCSVSPACRLGCRSLPESRQEREVCSSAVPHLPVALGAEACRRADRGARCAVVHCLTCLSPWVQKPAGEQSGALGVQWCCGAVSHLPVALGAEACRRADRGARCAVVRTPAPSRLLLAPFTRPVRTVPITSKRKPGYPRLPILLAMRKLDRWRLLEDNSWIDSISQLSSHC